MAGSDNYVIVRSNGVPKNLRTWMLDSLTVGADEITDVHIPANVLIVGDDLVSDSNPLPVYMATGDLSGYVDGLESALSTIAGHVDGLETLIGTSNTLASTLQTSTDSLVTATENMEAAITGTLEVGGAVADDAAASGNPVPVGGRYTATRPTLSDGDRGELRVTTKGELTVAPVQELTAADAVANTSIGFFVSNGGIGRVAAVGEYIFNGSTWDRVTSPNATSRIPTSAASVNATSAKASAGRIFTIIAYNTTASTIYLKVYNKASAPTVGSDTPILTLPIPPGGGLAIDWAKGFYCSTGIAYALTTSVADAGSAAVGAGDVTGLNVVYA